MVIINVCSVCLEGRSAVTSPGYESCINPGQKVSALNLNSQEDFLFSNDHLLSRLTF